MRQSNFKFRTDVPARRKQPPLGTTIHEAHETEAHRKTREEGDSVSQKPPPRFFPRQAIPVAANYHLPGTAPLTSTLVDAPRRISRDVIRGGHGITAKGWERRWDVVVCDENLPNRCSRHFDPRQTGVRRRRSPSAAHAPRKRSGLWYRTWAEVHPRRGRYGRRDRSSKPTGGELLVRIRDCENAIQLSVLLASKPIPLV